MKLYRGTGCHVVLVGILAGTPILRMDECGEFVAVIEVHVCTPNETTMKQFDVLVLEEAALRIRQYGFPGLYLLIEGVLQNQINHAPLKNTQILAEKIVFLDGTEPGTSNMKNNLNTQFFSGKIQNDFPMEHKYLH